MENQITARNAGSIKARILTEGAGLPGDAVGKIDIFPTRSYVAITRNHAETALQRLREGKIKGRSFRVRRIGH